MLFRPKWVKMLPRHLVPPDSMVSGLESLRKTIGCPHDAFGIKILGSSYATRRTMYLTYTLLKQQWQDHTERDVLSEVCEARLALSTEPGLAVLSSDEIVKEYGSIEKLVDFFVRKEAENSLPDPYGWGKRIDEMLDEGRQRE